MSGVLETMCGRARCSLSREEAAKKADLPEEGWKDIEKYEPRYNMQPGSNALVTVKKDGEVLPLTCIIPLSAWGLSTEPCRRTEKHDLNKFKAGF